MFISLSTISNKLSQYLTQRIDQFGHAYQPFGIFGLITYPTYYLIWKFSHSQSYENFSLRLIAIVLCSLLIFKDAWPPKYKKFLPIYWYITLCYCLPFLFTFFLFKNNFSYAAVLNSMTVLILLLLIVDVFAFGIILCIGVLIGAGFYKLSGGIFFLPSDYLTFLITYGSIIIFGIIFARRRENTHSEKIQTLNSIAASIAHELRTPLRTISSGATGLKKYLPKFFTTYKIAYQQNLTIPHLTPMMFQSLEQTCEDIEEEAKASFMIIDMLLVKLNSLNSLKLTPADTTIETIYHCLTEALARYPFNMGEKELVHCEFKLDFQFKGNTLLVIHVIFNLLKNAIYYAKASGKEDAKVYIWTGTQEMYNLVFIKDTGTGIANNQLPYIFECFYSKTTNGTGIGLAFCKLVMKNFGGYITCRSSEGCYTEFCLFFPKLIPSFKEYYSE